MLAINAIKEPGDVQPPESFLCERDDGLNSWKIQVEQERLRSCRVTEVLFVFFPAVSCSNEHFRTFKFDNKLINDNRTIKVTVTVCACS